MCLCVYTHAHNGYPLKHSYPGQNTGVGSLSLLQGIFTTQGSNPGLPHCRRILYQLSHKGSPRRLEWVASPFSSGSSWPRNWTKVSCIAGRFFTNWAMREAPTTIITLASESSVAMEYAHGYKYGKRKWTNLKPISLTDLLFYYQQHYLLLSLPVLMARMYYLINISVYKWKLLSKIWE